MLDCSCLLFDFNDQGEDNYSVYVHYVYMYILLYRRPGKSVYVPPHLYGQLIQHSEGAEIVSNLPYLSEYFDTIRGHDLHSDHTDNIYECKAAIWIAVSKSLIFSPQR